MGKVKDLYARARAIQTAKEVETITGSTLGTINSRLENIESSLSILTSLQNNITSLLSRISTLETMLETYENHNHNYIDNDGTTETTKTTGGVN